ncbi:MAG TPA: dihydroorotate dehydrogenase electron transfer subunit [Candidatus Dormibacteraeota bacterium]|nr:dihydroorotate dehydrogenase electron transfer subunit [Candidatus Dormibacteraeota bacterium]
MSPPTAPLPVSDLGRAVDRPARVTEVLDLGAGSWELVLACPEIAARARPGEFLQVQVDPAPVPLLRRPFSVCWADPASGALGIYFGVTGIGTARLAGLAVGDAVRVLGPLGRGYTLPPGPATTLCVAGGLGAAPFPFLARALTAAGATVRWLNGAASADRLYPIERLGAPVTAAVVTQDGSRGRPGVVTDILPGLLAGADRVYACGPNPMLAAVADVCAAAPTPVALEVSLEAPMGCGFGTCLGCALPVRGPEALALCCRQGPVLPADAVDWPALLALPPAHVA